MALLRLCFFLAFLVALHVAYAGTAHAEDAAGLRSGIWDVSTLVPGRGAVPPSHELHVEAGQWAVHERHLSRVSRWLDAVAARLGITFAAVPGDEAALCHAAALPSLELAATRTEEGVALDCNAGDWFTPASLRTFARDGYLRLHFESPQRLSVRANGTCVDTAWSVEDVSFAKVSEETVIISGTVRDASGGAPSSCKAYFELTRRPTAAAKATSSSPSAYAPIALLLVVMAMRLLPRYILTRTGQIDASSYRGKNPGNLSAERRAELLRKQRRILERMKAEDRANAPKEKTS